MSWTTGKLNLLSETLTFLQKIEHSKRTNFNITALKRAVAASRLEIQILHKGNPQLVLFYELQEGSLSVLAFAVFSQELALLLE